jgi:hypothetical protein
MNGYSWLRISMKGIGLRGRRSEDRKAGRKRKPQIHDDAAFQGRGISEAATEEIRGHVHGSYSSVTSHIHPTPPARAV